MSSVVKGPITLVWLLLIAATAFSAALGTDHHFGLGGGYKAEGALIFVVSFMKIDLVGRWFMELRDAPAVLRGLFDAWCILVCFVLVGFLAAAG